MNEKDIVCGYMDLLELENLNLPMKYIQMLLENYKINGGIDIKDKSK